VLSLLIALAVWEAALAADVGGHRHRHKLHKLRKAQAMTLNEQTRACPAGYGGVDLQIANPTFNYPDQVPNVVRVPALPAIPPATACGEMVATVHSRMVAHCLANAGCVSTMIGIARDSAGNWHGANSGANNAAVGTVLTALHVAIAPALTAANKITLVTNAVNFWAPGGVVGHPHVAAYNWKFWDANGNRDRNWAQMHTEVTAGHVATAFNLNNDGQGGMRVESPAGRTTPIGGCAGQKLAIAAPRMRCMAEIWFEVAANGHAVAIGAGGGVNIDNSAGGATTYHNGQLVPSCRNCQILVQGSVTRA